jgi:hypothetical protein
MATDSWQPQRGDRVRVRATGEEVTAMKFAGSRVRVHHDSIADAESPERTSTGALTPVHRSSQRPPEWFELDELEPTEGGRSRPERR